MLIHNKYITLWNKISNRNYITHLKPNAINSNRKLGIFFYFFVSFLNLDKIQKI